MAPFEQGFGFVQPLETAIQVAQVHQVLAQMVEVVVLTIEGDGGLDEPRSHGPVAPVLFDQPHVVEGGGAFRRVRIDGQGPAVVVQGRVGLAGVIEQAGAVVQGRGETGLVLALPSQGEGCLESLPGFRAPVQAAQRHAVPVVGLHPRRGIHGQRVGPVQGHEGVGEMPGFVVAARQADPGGSSSGFRWSCPWATARAAG